MKNHLEVCAFGIQTCIIAEQVGATRVELCDNPIEGGTTPSYGAIKKIREAISIQLFPIIRPRSMNYYYDDYEWEIMLSDIKICKELGCDGISVGVQKISGEIDGDKMKRLAALAYPMEVTSNRVIDAVQNPFATLEVLIEAGCTRVLTSGQAATAPEGIAVLSQLVTQAAGRISIMPGAGVKSGNIQLLQSTGAYEFHTSARKAITNLVEYNNPGITDAGNMYVADVLELENILKLLNK